MLSLQKAGKRFGPRTLFLDADWLIRSRERTALVGANGAGKSTLMKILAGQESLDYGTVERMRGMSIGYLPQEGLSLTGRTAFEECLTVFDDLRAMEGECERLAAQLADLDHASPEYDSAAERYSLLHERLLALGGYALDAQVGAILTGLGFGKEDWPRPTGEFSGGWQMRIALAKLLLAKPNLLLLDEPTNHLDLEGILWLETAIQAANACLVVTHDRYFLENVATQMMEVNSIYPQSAFQVKGNYSEFLERREEFLEAQTKQQESLATKVRREVEWLRRGPKARTGKSRARIDSAGRLIEELSAANIRSRTATAQIDFTASDRKTKRLIEAEGIAKTLGGNRLFRNLNLTLSPGARIGLVGANGSGKTTLLKILEGIEAPDEGTVKRADRLQIVSFAQDRGAHLDPELSLRRTLCPDGDSVIYRGRPIHVAGWAKRFLFRDEQLDMPVSRLSGGERARVMIARLMLAPADVLLLDEPTNDLDIPTLEVLEDGLLEFSGAVVLVSHDRYLLDRVSTTVVGLNGGEGKVFADYSQWEASRNEPAADRAVVQSARVAAPADGPRKKLAYLEQREWDAMEETILEAEQELAARQQELQAASSDPKRVGEAYEKVQEAHRRVEELYARWAELEAKVAR